MSTATILAEHTFTEHTDHLRFYIAFETMARDMQLNTDIVEFNRDVSVINANDFYRTVAAVRRPFLRDTKLDALR